MFTKKTTIAVLGKGTHPLKVGNDLGKVQYETGTVVSPHLCLHTGFCTWVKESMYWYLL